ncbi:MAG: hypothetical protein CMP81_00620 [Fulvimarina sp.]|nr:hypothetical protein [Fulvimarina sp.]
MPDEGPAGTLLRTGLIVLGLGIFCLSAWLPLDALRTRPAMLAAANVLGDPAAWNGAAVTLDRFLSGLAPPGRCDGAAERSLVVLELARLDLLAESGTASRGRLRVLQAGALDRARHALACAPQDGAGWLHLAMLQQVGGMARSEVIRALQLSARFAPATPFVVRQRIRFAERLHDRQRRDGKGGPLAALLAADRAGLADRAARAGGSGR